MGLEKLDQASRPLDSLVAPGYDRFIVDAKSTTASIPV
jgi:hypothetical protein